LLLTYHPGVGVIARKIDNGKEVWKTPFKKSDPDTAPHSTHVALAMGSSTVIVTMGPEISILELQTGKILWRGSPQPGVKEWHSPVLFGSHLYVIADNKVVALSCNP
jgi:outer membrane protein assembly factor BamB